MRSLISIASIAPPWRIMRMPATDDSPQVPTVGLDNWRGGTGCSPRRLFSLSFSIFGGKRSGAKDDTDRGSEGGAS